MAPVSLSSEAEYQRGYGPLLDGFRKVDFGDVDALKAAINKKYCSSFSRTNSR